MQQVKLATDTDMVVLTREELEALQKQSQQVIDDSLVGVRWSLKDVIRRVGGYRHDSFVRYVIVPNKDKLFSIGALLSAPVGTSGQYWFRASVMAPWLEHNLQKITDGGWSWKGN
ncbi:DUF771 domain-containing protein [Schleiferilactobacillus harbinensis]|uniref:DUF771 domain-containing protein n=1 Tax=Schleiferilactobacillus harbinensis TaxID=304207 RepID=UPI0039E8B550